MEEQSRGSSRLCVQSRIHTDWILRDREFVAITKIDSAGHTPYQWEQPLIATSPLHSRSNPSRRIHASMIHSQPSNRLMSVGRKPVSLFI